MNETAVVTMRIDGNSAGAQAATRAARDEFTRFTGAVGTGARKASQDISQMERAIGSVRGQLRNLTGGLSAIFALREIGRAADAYANMSAKIRLAAGSTQEAARAQEALFGVAQRTSASLDSTVTLYGRLAMALREQNVSQGQTLAMTETINQALVVSGATAQEAASAVLQLSQAFGAGRLGGEEFNAVNEAGGRIMQAIAREMGVTRGELKALAAEGKITSDVMRRALGGEEAMRVAAEFALVPLTMSRAWQQMKNAAVAAIGEIDSELGASQGVAQFVANGARALERFGPAITSFAKAFQSSWELAFDGTAAQLDAFFGGFLSDFDRNASDFAGKAASFWDSFVQEAAKLPQNLKFFLTQAMFLFNNLQIDAVEAFELLGNGAEGVWLSMKENVSALTGSIKTLFGSAIDFVLTSYAGMVEKLASGASMLPGMTAGAVALQEFAAALREAATNEAEFAAQAKEASGQFAGQRAELTKGEAAIRARADSQRRGALAGLEGARADRDATAAASKLTDQTDDATKATRRNTVATDDNKDAKKRLAAEMRRLEAERKADEDYAERSESDRIDAENEYARAVGETNIRVREEIELAGLNEQSRRQLTNAFEGERIAREEANIQQRAGIRQTPAEIAARAQQITAALNYRDALQQTAQVTEETRSIISNGFYAMGDAVADFATGGIKSFSDFGDRLKDIAKRMVADLIAQFIRLKIIGPMLNGLFSGGGGGGGGWMGLAMGALAAGGSSGGLSGGSSGGAAGGMNWLQMLGAASGDGTGSSSGSGSMLQSGMSLYRMGSRLFGSGAAAAGNGLVAAPGGGFVYANPAAVGPPSYLQNGGALGRMGTLAAGAAGAYYGWNRTQGGHRVGAAAAYGAAGIAVAGTAAGLAGGATLGAAAGGAFAGLGAAAAIPIVGWILAALAFIDFASGGKVFGTKFRPDQVTQSISIGAGGGRSTQNLQEVRQRALFGGRQWRDTITEGSAEGREAAEQLFKQVGEAMKRAAKALGVEVPAMIEASFNVKDFFDKKGKVKADRREEFSIVNGVTYKENFEAFQKRVSAEALIAVVGQFDAAATGIAEAWRANADTLLAGAVFLLAAATDIKEGFKIIDGGLAETLKITEELAQGNESLADTYGRLSGQNRMLRDIFLDLGFVTDKTAEQFTRFADDFVTAAGGLERAGQLATGYIERFYSPEERQQMRLSRARTNATTELRDIGLSTGITGEEFRRLFEEALPTLSGAALAEWYEAAEALGILIEAEDELNEARVRAAQAAEQARLQASRAAYGDINDWAWEDWFAEMDPAMRGLAELEHLWMQRIEEARAARDAGLITEQDYLLVLGLRDRALRRYNDAQRESAERTEALTQVLLIQISAGEQALAQANRLAEIMNEVAGVLGSGGDFATQLEIQRDRWQALHSEARLLGASTEQLAMIQRAGGVAVTQLVEAERQRLEAMRSDRAEIRSWLDADQLGANSTLTPIEQLAEAQRQFEDLARRRDAGEAISASQLIQAAEAVEGLGRDVWGDSQRYTDLREAVRARMGGIAADDGADAELVTALDALTDILTRLANGTFFTFTGAGPGGTPTTGTGTTGGTGTGTGGFNGALAGGPPSNDPNWSWLPGTGWVYNVGVGSTGDAGGGSKPGGGSPTAKLEATADKHFELDREGTTALLAKLELLCVEVRGVRDENARIANVIDANALRNTEVAAR